MTPHTSKLPTEHSGLIHSDDMPKSCSKSQPDYEREYYRHIEIIKKLENENTELKNTILNMCNWLFGQRSEKK